MKQFNRAFVWFIGIVTFCTLSAGRLNTNGPNKVAITYATLLYPDLFSWAKPGTYMYDVLQDRNKSQRLLRFSAAIGNSGTGPLELHAIVESDGTTRATQWIYDDQGNHTERSAGTFVFSGHEGHHHFHFADFANYRLREVLAGNTIGDVVATSDKVGFAMFDSSPYDLSLNGAPSSAHYIRQEESSLDPQGVSVGWADVYGRSLGEQWIDVSKVHDGEYWLEVTVDPNGLIAESNESNNVTYVKIFLKHNDVSTNGDQPAIQSTSAIATRTGSEGTVGPETASSEQVEPNIVFYPNPTNGKFDVEIRGNSTGPYYMTIRDNAGMTLAEQIITKIDGIAKAQVDLTRARNGYYIVSIASNGQTVNKRIIVDK